MISLSFLTHSCGSTFNIFVVHHQGPEAYSRGGVFRPLVTPMDMSFALLEKVSIVLN